MFACRFLNITRPLTRSQAWKPAENEQFNATAAAIRKVLFVCERAFSIHAFFSHQRSGEWFFLFFLCRWMCVCSSASGESYFGQNIGVYIPKCHCRGDSPCKNDVFWDVLINPLSQRAWVQIVLRPFSFFYSEYVCEAKHTRTHTQVQARSNNTLAASSQVNSFPPVQHVNRALQWFMLLRSSQHISAAETLRM